MAYEPRIIVTATSGWPRRGRLGRANPHVAKAEVLHAIYERIVVTGRTIVSIRLTPSAYAHGVAVALPDKVALARPTGLEPPTFS